ncbi:MAG TPA: CoA transferase, partial [Myxococcota bacterium]|nr:CoA transferase [Myxococcota bacterium]
FLTKDSKFGLDGSPMYVLLNPDKESVSINMAVPEGVALARRLVGWADVVAENFSPGVMAKWGLDADAIHALRPDAVVVSGCLFGQTGPQRKYPGFGGQGSAIAGFNHLTGWPDREAHGPYGTITDSLSPRYVAVALVAALLERRRTGKGRHIDLSQIESAVYSLSEMIVRQSANGEGEVRRGNRNERAAPHGAYPCRGDDRWIAIAVEDDEAWHALVGALGDPDWARDPKLASAEGRLAAEAEIDRRLAAFTSEHDAFTLAESLQAARVPAGPVATFADLLDDPQLAHRGHFVPLRHVHLGELPFERSGFRLSASPGGFERPGPNLGQHNREVLGGVLGLSDEQIDDLAARDVVA